MFTCPTLSSLPNISHGFFGREGGHSTGLYASLNCGYGSGDDIETIEKNRAVVAAELGTKQLLTTFQIHSNRVVTVTEPWAWKDSPEADALVTKTPGIALGAVLANLLGTTGASMLLIRPVLRANAHRAHRVHTVVFFIFLVSNVGGCLLPIGDPPLF
ncbi:MAG: hypothetical protein EBR02_10070, partial [Alphaproteobacteria bacterium]|nr:hypothetical protein [Alphaproteobacteria bacterium]